jgi:hypothetical protein
MTRRFFDVTTVETASRSSIDYKYMTINNFDENIDDIKLDNIVIMTINTRTVSLKLDAHYADASFETILYCLTPRQGAAFDLTSNVLPDRRRVILTLVGTSVAMFGWC